MLSFSKEEVFESAWKIVDVWTPSILAKELWKWQLHQICNTEFFKLGSLDHRSDAKEENIYN